MALRRIAIELSAVTIQRFPLKTPLFNNSHPEPLWRCGLQRPNKQATTKERKIVWQMKPAD
jgi:hypothetical protein